MSRVAFLLKGLEDGWRTVPFERFLEGLTKDEADWDESTRRIFEPLTTPLTAEEAHWQPAPGARSIAEIINHMSYWLEYRVRQVRGEPLEPLRPVPKGGEAPAWMPSYPECLENLQRQFTALRDAIGSLKDEELERTVEGSPRPIVELISNIVAHNAYHIGQVVLMRKLWASAIREGGDKSEGERCI
jgi:uncharacterized damage-inducible protein DinB